jgi:hypothetical protein
MRTSVSKGTRQGSVLDIAEPFMSWSFGRVPFNAPRERIALDGSAPLLSHESISDPSPPSLLIRPP